MRRTDWQLLETIKTNTELIMSALSDLQAKFQALSDAVTQEDSDINAAIAAETSQKPSLHWIEVLDDAGIPCGPINTIDQTFADPQVQHLDMAKPVAHPRLGAQRIVGSAINLQGLDESPRFATADAGEHTEQVLTALGRTPAELAALREQRVI